jgi:hypothetical protein
MGGERGGHVRTWKRLFLFGRLSALRGLFFGRGTYFTGSTTTVLRWRCSFACSIPRSARNSVNSFAESTSVHSVSWVSYHLFFCFFFLEGSWRSDLRSRGSIGNQSKTLRRPQTNVRNWRSFAVDHMFEVTPKPDGRGVAQIKPNKPAGPVYSLISLSLRALIFFSSAAAPPDCTVAPKSERCRASWLIEFS